MTDWRVSSFSNGNANCVQVRSVRSTWLVRDSNDVSVDPPTLAVSAAGWAALLASTRTLGVVGRSPLATALRRRRTEVRNGTRVHVGHDSSMF